MTSDGWFGFDATDGDAPFVVTCEHASNRLPPGYSWPREDRWIVDTHWAYDLGAECLGTELAESLGGAAVFASFSRLLIDPNRPEDSATLIRQRADGRDISLNHGVDSHDRSRRLRYWRGYHAAVDRELAKSRAPVLLSMHSFTPLYQGMPRQVQVGILFDREEDLAKRLADHLRPMSLDVRLNEPYSGREGLIYAVQRHADRHRRRAIELEIRQDLASDPAARAALVGRLRSFVW